MFQFINYKDSIYKTTTLWRIEIKSLILEILFKVFFRLNKNGNLSFLDIFLNFIFKVKIIFKIFNFNQFKICEFCNDLVMK